MPKPDPDAWLTKPQSDKVLCRLYHGIDCKRGCGGYPGGLCYHSVIVKYEDGSRRCLYCKEEA